MGIDPVTHKPKNDALLSNDGQTKNAANLSHVAQWESARLEAEARLVRESKLRSRSFQHQPSSMTTPGYIPGSVPMTEFVGTSGSTETGIIEEKGFPDVTVSMEVPWNPESSRADNNSVHVGNVMEEGFTHLLLCDSAERSLPDNGKDSDHGGGTGSDYYEDNKNYWNRILNLVNSSPI
ncbi:MYB TRANSCRIPTION FACTOR MIXTA-LIKE PROTEIN [Salix viminalis]|uniref:MYB TRANSCRIPTION FACTOR MIXTA-LIKE PROTEIN n=1 Tax=Salix viminalis TaxID=40686 RepID=A0A9Q0TBE3_SALVM|nr:MYB TRANSCRIPTION FACTOR MIXTA-LIKE PROTEIN [Salix viminalis]